MGNPITIRKTAYILACLLGVTYLVASCSSENAEQIIADEFVSITGTINNHDDTAEPGVEIEGVYGSPGDALNPDPVISDSSATNNFSLEVFSNTPFYLHATKDSFATINTARTALNADITVDAVEIPSVIEAQDMINTAFDVDKPLLENHAWLVVDVVDANGIGVDGKTISTAGTDPVAVYTDCEGNDSGGTVTVAPCPAGRQGPMYIAYFDAPAEISITVGGQKQTAPIRMGEITVLEFVVAANEYFTVSGKVNNLTNTAAVDNVDIEAVYTVPGDSRNPTGTTDGNGNYSLELLKNKPAFLQFTKTGFATVNTLQLELNDNLPGIDIRFPTRTEAQDDVIDIAFVVAPVPTLADHAWLMVDVLDGGGDERGGQTISSTPGPVAEVYTECDGIDDGAVATKSCPNRAGPMYIGYFDGIDRTTVSVTSVIQTAPLEAGDITYLVFKPEPTGP